MRPRNEVLIAAIVFVLLIAGAALLGKRDQRVADFDPRASAQVSTPYGLKGFAEALTRLGYEVDPSLEPAGTLLSETPEDAVIIVARPRDELRDSDVGLLLQSNRALVFAGQRNELALWCLGYQLQPLWLDSAAVREPNAVLHAGSWTNAVLETVEKSSSAPGDADVACGTAPVARTDTLLVDSRGRVVALRLTTSDGRERTLLADDAVLSNSQLRRSLLAPRILPLIVGARRPVIFAEYYQGIHIPDRGWGAVFAWSRSHPGGWALWQLIIVGALAFLVGAVRFGPVVHVVVRTRRSSQEHVSALAKALSAANGHEVAMASLIRGLQRRLELTGIATRGDQRDWRSWLSALKRRAPNVRAKTAIEQLEQTTQGHLNSMSVLNAANSVEDVWEALYR